MLRIAGQTAGPIGLNFFVDTHGWPGGCYRPNKFELKKFNLNFLFNFFFTSNSGPSASCI